MAAVNPHAMGQGGRRVNKYPLKRAMEQQHWAPNMRRRSCPQMQAELHAMRPQRGQAGLQQNGLADTPIAPATAGLANTPHHAAGDLHQGAVTDAQVERYFEAEFEQDLGHVAKRIAMLKEKHTDALGRCRGRIDMQRLHRVNVAALDELLRFCQIANGAARLSHRERLHRDLDNMLLVFEAGEEILERLGADTSVSEYTSSVSEERRPTAHSRIMITEILLKETRVFEEGGRQLGRLMSSLAYHRTNNIDSYADGVERFLGKLQTEFQENQIPKLEHLNNKAKVAEVIRLVMKEWLPERQKVYKEQRYEKGKEAHETPGKRWFDMFYRSAKRGYAPPVTPAAVAHTQKMVGQVLANEEVQAGVANLAHSQQQRDVRNRPWPDRQRQMYGQHAPVPEAPVRHAPKVV